MSTWCLEAAFAIAGTETYTCCISGTCGDEEDKLQPWQPAREGRVLGLFRETLGLERLEPSDDFFQSGADDAATTCLCEPP